jgi:hypothetical protein
VKKPLSSVEQFKPATAYNPSSYLTAPNGSNKIISPTVANYKPPSPSPALLSIPQYGKNAYNLNVSL